jgi:hypothetical protein
MSRIDQSTGFFFNSAFPEIGEFYCRYFSTCVETALPHSNFSTIFHIIPCMMIDMQVPAPYLSLSISTLVITWLSACAVFDIHSHRVPNWLTLPALPAVLLASWLIRGMRSETHTGFLLHFLILSLALVLAWRCHLMGGADLKILVILALINPMLVLAAWAGAFVYVFGAMIIHHERSNRYAGVPGFALGIALFTIGQLGVLITQRLAA